MLKMEATKSFKRRVIQRNNVIITFRVRNKIYQDLIDISNVSDTTVSELIRKALAPVLDLRSDFIHFIPPICPKCGGYLSGFLGSDRLYCVKCGKIYKLEEEIKK